MASVSARDVTPKAASAGDRVACLDGLRGVAAVGVVAFHFFYAFDPAPFADKARTGFGIIDLPVAALWNGRFSVAVFFVLSGFVLAASSPRTLREAPFMIALRYFRLALPAVASSVIAWAWLTGFPHAAHEAQAISGSRWFYWTYQAPIPPLSQALWEGAVGVFVEGTTKFNNPLWTMRTEFLGSVLIYGAYALIAPRWRAGAMVAGLVGLAIAQEYGLAAFCGGALVFEARHRLVSHTALGAGLCLLGLVLGGPFPGHVPGPGLGDLILSHLGTDGVREAGALCLIVSILMTQQLRRAFAHPLLLRLGELSFPLYLVHVPLICAPVSWLFVHFAPLSPASLGLLFLLLLATSLLLAGVFLVAVERPVLALLRTVRTRGRARLAAL